MRYNVTQSRARALCIRALCAAGACNVELLRKAKDPNGVAIGHPEYVMTLYGLQYRKNANNGLSIAIPGITLGGDTQPRFLGLATSAVAAGVPAVGDLLRLEGDRLSPVVDVIAHADGLYELRFGGDADEPAL